MDGRIKSIIATKINLWSMMCRAVREPTQKIHSNELTGPKLNKEGSLFKDSLPNSLKRSLIEHQYKKSPTVL